MFLAQTHDLARLAGRAHARLDLAEAVEHLIQPGLGQSQRVGDLRYRRGLSYSDRRAIAS